MAVEARHLNFLKNGVVDPYNGGYGLPPLSGTTTESFVPVYNHQSGGVAVAGVVDSIPAKEADSGLSSYAHQLPVSRKRARESIHPMMRCQVLNANRCGSFTFLGEDVSLQIQQQQLEVDRFIAQHNDEVRREMEERRKRYSRRIIAAVEQGVMKRLKAKDDEIEKIGKLNWALQEKVKSLSIEGQNWRDLAHFNEAAAHALRTNLDQVLAAAQLGQNEQFSVDVAAAANDVRSCCGSNDREEEEEEDEECGTRGGERKCRHCGEGESSVLLLPCRHLCLCTVCGSSVHTCPVCKIPKNASVHVIISS